MSYQSHIKVAQYDALAAFGKAARFVVFGLLLLTAVNVTVRGQRIDDFSSNANNSVYSIVIQPDGKIVIGGTFSSVGGQVRNGVARVNADGTPDASFVNPNVNAVVLVIALQTDGKILIGGNFTNVGGQTRNRLARLNADGTLDTTFNANFSHYVGSIVLQPGGKIIVGGDFETVNGAARSYLARLNADGTIDTSFTQTVNDNVRGTVAQADGKILISGYFSEVGGVARNRIARLNADGTLDTSFTFPATVFYPFHEGISEIAIQADGKIIIDGNGTAGGLIKIVSRLDTDGKFDTAFNQNVPSSGGYVNTIAVQANGKIIVGGNFPYTNRLFRLNADGTADDTFNPLPNGSVSALAVQSDQKILAGGDFTVLNGQPRGRIARLLTDSLPRQVTKLDFDGDSKADVSAFRPSNGGWYIYPSRVWSSPNPPITVQFGISTDRIVPADYDGDLVTDIAVFREGATAYFYILQTTTNTIRAEPFGTTGDVPAVGDWDGDGKTDVTVYRNGAAAGAQSYFYYRPTAATGADFRQIAWGASGDKPVVGDFDADGKQDAAIFRPSNGTWYISRSSDNQLQAFPFGIATDKLVAADYDGDNKTDIAVYRAGTWYIQRSQLGFTAVQFGAADDVPIPADYEGDGKIDIGVFRNGTWYLNLSTGVMTGGNYSVAGDKPIPSAYVQ